MVRHPSRQAPLRKLWVISVLCQQGGFVDLSLGVQVMNCQAIIGSLGIPVGRFKMGSCEDFAHDWGNHDDLDEGEQRHIRQLLLPRHSKSVSPPHLVSRETLFFWYDAYLQETQ